MLDRAKSRTLPLLGRSAELAPAAQACCGTCRTCVTTNIFAVGAAAVMGAAYWVAGRLRSSARPAA